MNTMLSGLLLRAGLPHRSKVEQADTLLGIMLVIWTGTPLLMMGLRGLADLHGWSTGSPLEGEAFQLALFQVAGGLLCFFSIRMTFPFKALLAAAMALILLGRFGAALLWTIQEPGSASLPSPWFLLYAGLGGLTLASLPAIRYFMSLEQQPEVREAAQTSLQLAPARYHFRE